MKANQIKILIVEDDETIAAIMKRELEKWSYNVILIEDFNKVMDVFRVENPQLVLLDIVLPYFNGYYWCQEIRKESKVPIIFISSKSENMDIVMGVQTGGDDYITKPLDMSIMVAKVQAIIRRTYDFVAEIKTLNFDQITLDLGESKITFDGKEIELTRTEFQIMESLFRAQGQIVSREKIMEKCWSGDHYIDDNTLAVNVTRLRKKLDTMGLEGLIQTKKGQGYSLYRK